MSGPKVKYPQPTPSDLKLQELQVATLEDQRRMLQEAYEREKMLSPLMYDVMGIEEVRDEAGRITGYKKKELTAEEKLAKEIYGKQLERTQQALAGELPVNPAWGKQKTETIASFEEAMRRQGLKPGDTAYDQAWADLQSTLQGAEYGMRTGDIGFYEGMSMARGQEQNRLQQQALSQYGMVPGMRYAGAESFGQAAAGYNAPRQLGIQERYNRTMADYYSSQAPSFAQKWLAPVGQFLGGMGSFVRGLRG